MFEFFKLKVWNNEVLFVSIEKLSGKGVVYGFL